MSSSSSFILYADKLLSITPITGLLSPSYTTLNNQIREVETAYRRGVPTVWERIYHTIDGPTQVDEIQQVYAGFKR